MFFQYFYQALEQNWDNLNVIFVTWDMFLHTGLTEFHMFFKTKYTAFFSLVVFVIFRLVLLVVTKGDTYLNKPGGLRERVAKVCMTFCLLPPSVKGLKDVLEIFKE